jgi:hypothetical protein
MKGSDENAISPKQAFNTLMQVNENRRAIMYLTIEITYWLIGVALPTTSDMRKEESRGAPFRVSSPLLKRDNDRGKTRQLKG